MCGIFGIVNHHKRLLDKRAFITLGCSNDSRGGDACGIMIDGQVDKGTEGNDKYFQCWYNKSNLLKNTEKCYVALGHCRKASVGGVAPDKAQPIIIYGEDGRMDFCLIHNGTIYNYEELAAKYIPDINIKNMTDSQVMANIFYYKGYDVLAEYNGGGAFVIHDYRINKTYIFRGESKGTLSAVKPVPERPLYFVQTGKSFIFSSIYDILQGLYWGFTVYDMPSNILLECTGDNIYMVKEYDRSEQFGCKKVKVTKITSYSYDSYLDNLYAEPSHITYDALRGVYTDTNKPRLELHGICHIGPKGHICKYKSEYTSTYYFWRGIMLSGENAYNAVRDFLASDKSVTPKAALNLARRLSCNPVFINNRFWTYTIDHLREPFTDDYVFPATNVEIVCDERGKSMATFTAKEIYKFVPTNVSTETINQIVDYVKASLQRDNE